MLNYSEKPLFYFILVVVLLEFLFGSLILIK